MINKKIAIIGGGNLGRSIAEGLILSDKIDNKNISVSDIHYHQLEELKKHSVFVTNDNLLAIKDADIIIISVKPYHIKGVLSGIFNGLNLQKQTIISTAAGVNIVDMEEIVGSDIPIFRIMPNTAIAICQSMTCIATKRASEEKTNEIKQLFDELGDSVIINEELMGAATVLGACGIAFALRFIRAAMQGGVEIGFSADMALQITAQTVKGATELLIKNGQHPEKEIDKVTTPQGITITGLNAMEHQGFSSSLIQGLLASYKKIH